MWLTLPRNLEELSPNCGLNATGPCLSEVPGVWRNGCILLCPMIIPQMPAFTQRATCSLVLWPLWPVYLALMEKIGWNHLLLLWFYVQLSSWEANISAQEEKCPWNPRTRWPQIWDDFATSSDTKSLAFVLLCPLWTHQSYPDVMHPDWVSPCPCFCGGIWWGLLAQTSSVFC